MPNARCPMPDAQFPIPKYYECNSSDHFIGWKMCQIISGRLRESLRTFNDNPVEVARQWVNEGATMLHLVDLDGAKAGHPSQRSSH